MTYLARVALCALLLGGCAGMMREDTYAAATTKDFDAWVEVGNDDVEGFRYASSRNTIRSWAMLLRPYVWVVERDGRATVSIYAYTDTSEWVFPTKAYIGTPSRTPELVRVDSDVDCGFRSCSHSETSRLMLSDDDVRALVADGQDETIQIRIVGRAGIRCDGYIRKAEIVAALKALDLIDQYR